MVSLVPHISKNKRGTREMTLYDIIPFIDIPQVNTLTGFISLAFVALVTIIQVSPIKINPWDLLLGWVGDRLNSHIIKRVDEMDEKLTEHIQESRDSSVKRRRQRILNFVEQGMEGKRYTKESFDYMIKECDEYETYIKEHDIKNGVIEASITEIRKRYINHIHNADFAPLEKMESQDLENRDK